MKDFDMERTPKLKLSSVYGICAMKEFERRTHMDIANGMDITRTVVPMMKTLFEVKTINDCPQYLAPDDCELNSEMLSELIGITVTPYEYSSLWNKHVRAWEAQQLTGMCPIATVDYHYTGAVERIQICWDDFGDLMLHSARGVVVPGEVFADPDDAENLRRIRDVIKRIYGNVKFSHYAYGGMNAFAENLVSMGYTASRHDLRKIEGEYQLDEEAMEYLRRLMTIIIDGSVG